LAAFSYLILNKVNIEKLIIMTDQEVSMLQRDDANKVQDEAIIEFEPSPQS